MVSLRTDSGQPQAELAPGLARPLQTYENFLTVERGLAPHTVAAYRRDLLRLAWFAQHHHDSLEHCVSVEDLTPSLLDRWMLHLGQGDEHHHPLRSASISRALSAARGWLAFLVAEGHLQADPSAHLDTPKVPMRLPQALPVSTVQALLQAAAQTPGPLGMRDVVLMELLYGTGGRISEIVGLNLENLELQQATVRLHGKGGKQRIVPVGGYALRAATNYLQQARGQLLEHNRSQHFTTSALVLNARGSRLSRQGAWGVVKGCASRAGVSQQISPHSLRHSFATHLLDGGANVRVVQELLGHANITTTQLYTQVTVDNLRQVYLTCHPRAL